MRILSISPKIVLTIALSNFKDSLVQKFTKRLPTITMPENTATQVLAHQH